MSGPSVLGLLAELRKVRPDLRPVLLVASEAHRAAGRVRSHGSTAGSTSTERPPRRLSTARRAQIDQQVRCALGHFQGDRPCRPCRGCRGR